MKSLFVLLSLCLPFMGTSGMDDVFSKFPDMEGFSKKLTPEVYVPDNLWDYINGAADAYLGYGFTDLHMAEYKKGRKNSVRVEIYRHSSPENAFGIYANERFPDYHFIDVGVQGYQQGNVLNFYSDVYYVKIYASSEDEKVISAMEKIAARLAQNLGGNTGFPEVLAGFPAENKVENRESYAAINFMGYSFYHSVFVSEYREGDKTFRIFCFEGESPEDCRSVLAKHEELAGNKTSELKPGRMVIRDPYNGTTWLLWKDNMIWGIVDLTDEGVASGYMDKLENN